MLRLLLQPTKEVHNRAFIRRYTKVKLNKKYSKMVEELSKTIKIIHQYYIFLQEKEKFINKKYVYNKAATVSGALYIQRIVLSTDFFLEEIIHYSQKNSLFFLNKSFTNLQQIKRKKLDLRCETICYKLIVRVEKLI